MTTISTPALTELEPQSVWTEFAAIAAIPRASGNEARVQAHIQEWARARGWKTRADSKQNVVVEVPATKGRENAPVIVLQAHTDMVAIKRESSSHDFGRDPIELVVDLRDGELVVRANDTTLGADNGIGAAMALAAAVDPSVAHGPLELLLTVEEETGLHGAKVIEPGFFRGRMMLNIDTEEENVIYIGCVGGAATFLTWNLALLPAPANAAFATVSVTGLRGGHSGLEIHQNRGNALQVLGRVLSALGKEAHCFAAIDGGTRRNAIADRAQATVALLGASLADLRGVAARIAAEVKEELEENGTGLRIDVASAPAADRVVSVRESALIAHAMVYAPHGVLAMDPQAPETVETSANVAIIAMQRTGDEAHVTMEVSVRSLLRDKLASIPELYRLVGEEHEAAVTSTFGYPPWTPMHDSTLLARARAVHERLFGIVPRVASIHGGLECGIIGDRVPGMEMISIGPRIEEAHTPEERVYVASVARFWRYLVALLDELSAP